MGVLAQTWSWLTSIVKTPQGENYEMTVHVPQSQLIVPQQQLTLAMSKNSFSEAFTTPFVLLGLIIGGSQLAATFLHNHLRRRG
mmetsp:Transcript_17630/g.31875  ORF Transcript_17630/g.31875 Transcript_17630/m.31875 type:complete len:84 (+) Transcript_17630:85-336(+)